MYKARGFNIDVFHGDKDFNLNALKEHIRSASLNICAKGKHISIFESSIQTINEGERCTTHSVTYNIYTNLMKFSLVECIVHSSNSFPHQGSIIKRLGANTVLLGNSSPNFNTKIFYLDPTTWYTQVQKKIG